LLKEYLEYIKMHVSWSFIIAVLQANALLQILHIRAIITYNSEFI